MKLFSQVANLQECLDELRSQKKSVGLVPTMGYLHEGHLSLVERSNEENDVTVTTIFVNPLQFAEGEDLSSYPSDLQSDIEQCEKAGSDVLFTPSLQDMYPEPILTSVQVDDFTKRMEGKSRPTHFAGVATVVAKLFNIAGPCNAYFGEKDWQQLQVITKMVRDLSFRVCVIGCPIIRHKDGLALSSRNAYLTPDERQSATVLSRSLHKASDLIRAGETSSVDIQKLIEREIASEPLVKLDYVETVDGSSLITVDEIVPGTRILIAAAVGKARLIDNIEAFTGITAGSS